MSIFGASITSVRALDERTAQVLPMFMTLEGQYSFLLGEKIPRQKAAKETCMLPRNAAILLKHFKPQPSYLYVVWDIVLRTSQCLYRYKIILSGIDGPRQRFWSVVSSSDPSHRPPCYQAHLDTPTPVRQTLCTSSAYHGTTHLLILVTAFYIGAPYILRGIDCAALRKCV
jgi:hypothetical protein